MQINDLTSVNRRQLEGIILDASRKTGANFAYMMDKAQQESGLRVDAKAKTSSASGLYQFIDQTWLNMLKAHGAKHGYAEVAQKIESKPNGQAFVADATERQQILNLRHDAKISALMAGEFARENTEHLKAKTDRPVGKTEMYLAHFLGAGGAAKFINALEQQPQQDAASLLPAAARSNRSVFFDKDGSPRSVAEIYNRFANRFAEAHDFHKHETEMDKRHATVITVADNGAGNSNSAQLAYAHSAYSQSVRLTGSNVPAYPVSLLTETLEIQQGGKLGALLISGFSVPDDLVHLRQDKYDDANENDRA